jgi:CBS domain-containing protein
MATVKDILNKKGAFVAHVDINSSVLETTQFMNDKRIGSVVVCNEDKVVGIFTERDILSRIVAAQADPAATTVGEVMTAPVACCLPATTIDECKDVMTEKRIRHLPVVEDNNLLGIVTSGDIIALEKAKGHETIKYLNEYIFGPYAGENS